MTESIYNVFTHFISKQGCLALKELGFQLYQVKNENDIGNDPYTTGITWFDELPVDDPGWADCRRYVYPPLPVVTEWLRRVKGIYLQPVLRLEEKSLEPVWVCKIIVLNPDLLSEEIPEKDSRYFDRPESALSSGILAVIDCLTKKENP